MVLIGDPKQAIYAFRGGDVVTYLAAEETAGAKMTLGTNFRSDRPLLDSVQAVLRGAALGDERIVVRDVRAHHEDRRLEGAPRPEPFRLRMVDRQRFNVKPTKGVGIGLLRDLVADDLAADIRALLAAEPTYCGERLEARQVAVLCETRRQCETARDGLVRAGVQAVIAGSGSVYATEGADEWLCLLEAMEAPHRSARVRAAALTSFFGHTAAELDARRRRADRAGLGDAARLGRPDADAWGGGGVRDRGRRPRRPRAGAAARGRRAPAHRPAPRRGVAARRVHPRASRSDRAAGVDARPHGRGPQRRHRRAHPPPRLRRRGGADPHHPRQQGAAVPGGLPAVRLRPLPAHPAGAAVPRRARAAAASTSAAPTRRTPG